MTDPAPRRLRIVGTSGSGKTTLARRVAARVDVAHLELDAVFWDAGWRLRDPEEALGIIRSFTAAHPDGWVADGNWTSMLQGLLDPGTPDGADIVVWLDESRAVVMWRIVTRTLRRGLLREELWHGNRERIASWFRWDPQHNIVRWAWTSHARNRERMRSRIDTGEPVVRLRGRRAVEEWLRALPGDGRSVEG